MSVNPQFAPIPQVGFPKITPKFLNLLERVQSRHRRDMDRLELKKKQHEILALQKANKRSSDYIKEIEIGGQNIQTHPIRDYGAKNYDIDSVNPDDLESIG